MHNKFVVLLKKDKKNVVPKAVWSGSTNWTDGGIYGQLNVGHAVYDDEVAAAYENISNCFTTMPTHQRSNTRSEI